MTKRIIRFLPPLKVKFIRISTSAYKLICAFVKKTAIFFFSTKNRAFNTAFGLLCAAAYLVTFLSLYGEMSRGGKPEYEFISLSEDLAMSQAATAENDYLEESEDIKVHINTDGSLKTVYTTAKTVNDALSSGGVELDDNDRTTLPLNAYTYDGMRIDVVRVDIKSTSATSRLPFSVKILPTISGKSYYVESKGKNGVLTKYMETVYENGKKTSSKVVKEQVTTEPVHCIVRFGDGGTITTPDGQTLKYTKKIPVTATAYGPGDDGGYRTATGTLCKYGSIAVDPRLIPLGTKLYVTSVDGSSWIYGIGKAEDTGGAIKGTKIDLYFTSDKEVYKFGVKSAMVYVLE